MNTDGKRFNIVYLREAVEFLESLDNKAREKVAYNITKAMLVVDKELFKKDDRHGHMGIQNPAPRNFIQAAGFLGH